MEIRRRTPLTKRQLTFLRARILKQRKRDQLGGYESGCEVVGGTSRDVTGEGLQRRCYEDQQSSLDQSDQSKDAEGECVEDVVKQIDVLQSRLESLREEKHRLFKQLKTVLHEEDERKRIKLEVMKSNEITSNMDPRMTMVGSMRHLPNSPTDMQKKLLKSPLLPTPEQAMYSRQGPPYRYSAESFHTTRQLFAPQGHVAGGHMPPFHEHFVPTVQELNLPCKMRTIFEHGLVPTPNETPSHDFPRPPLTPGQAYNQQHPVVQDLQGQYSAVAHYQYSPSATQFSGLQSTVQSNQGTHLPYQQPSYVQPHPQEILSYPHIQSQPQLQDVHVHPQLQTQHDTQNTQPGNPPFLAQGNQMANFAEHSYGQNIQDPRHQKLVIEHRCSSSGGSLANSPVSSNSQDQSGSPNQSPAYTQPRDRKYSSKKQ